MIFIWINPPSPKRPINTNVDMAKPKKSAPSSSRKSVSAGPSVVRRLGVHLAIFILIAGGFIGFFRVMRNYVTRDLVFPTRPPKVVLKNRPAWMSDFLAEEIIKNARPIGLHSAFDHQLLVDTVNLLKSNPWIKQVNQVRRVYDEKPADTIEIDCDYRAPVALVKWDDYYWLVDGEGVKLPEQYTAAQLPRIMFGSDGKVNVRIIDGVAHAPVESGNVWPGDDLAGGLELIKLLSGRPYAEEIRWVDVTNFGARKDAQAAQIVLGTQYGTQIRWGRVPSAKDYFIEVSVATKLAALQSVFEQKKRVDGNQPWIDIRFDRITCPEPTPTSAEPAGAH
jgi:hypothetical protein